MSRSSSPPGRVPLIAVVQRAHRALQSEMVVEAHRRGFLAVKPAHNAVFATLPVEGMRTVDMAAAMGVTRQSMGEIVRDLVAAGILEMVPDPVDRRAKLVRYTAEGLRIASAGSDHLRDLERRIVQDVGRDEYEVTRRVLARITDLLDGPHASPPGP